MRKIVCKKKLKAFSLFEILITIGVLLALSSIVFPLTVAKVQEVKLKSHASELVTDIYLLQQEAYYKGSPRGVSFTSHGYTLFDGEDLSTATEKNSKTLPNNLSITSISFSTNQEFYFPMNEFKPSESGYVILTDGFHSIIVNINSEGLIEYGNI
mgnify:CR=1 FL=1